jgi:hypothetical protein
MHLDRAAEAHRRRAVVETEHVDEHDRRVAVVGDRYDARQVVSRARVTESPAPQRPRTFLEPFASGGSGVRGAGAPFSNTSRVGGCRCSRYPGPRHPAGVAPEDIEGRADARRAEELADSAYKRPVRARLTECPLLNRSPPLRPSAGELETRLLSALELSSRDPLISSPLMCYPHLTILRWPAYGRVASAVRFGFTAGRAIEVV